MDLFENIKGKPENRLPQDGIVNYYGTLMSQREANDYFNSLLSKVTWMNDEVIIFGKRIVTKRKMAWYGEKPFEYTYSNTSKKALPWIDELLALKEIIEEKTNEMFNSCLLNLYHDGDEGMGWHSDDEPDLKKDSAIASMSFGAERKFSFKHKKSKETMSLVLQHGSLLIMKGLTQTHWMHSLPKTKMVSTPRINLTFRTMV
ncbi:MAG: alpha-ketoglutarate-dependent dioxygenase AlkB [Gammaproteobacteria bacterium]|nr:alpha-ketoglutarate-dependent dioxygenase AlkB [Gammaproteobacteria bacterium]